MFIVLTSCLVDMRMENAVPLPAMHSLRSSRTFLQRNNNLTHKHIETKLIFIGYGEFESKKNKST